MSANTIIKNGIPHIIAFFIFLLATAFYFTAQLNGKVEKSHDIVGARANLQEIEKYEAQSGERSMWTNTIFGGMPTYQIDGSQKSNMTKYMEKGSRLFIARPIGMFFAAMIGFYIMLVLLGVNPWLSIVGALAFGLSTNHYVLYSAGHISKIKAIFYFGLITAGVLMAFRKKYLIGGLVFATGLALNLFANHVQMTYYFFLTLLAYGLFELIQHIMNKDLASYGKAVLFLLAGGAIAVGSSASKLLPSYEYGQDTMRGDPILAVDASVPKTSSNTSGLDYGYATKWSNGYMDMVATFIPGVVGGGGIDYWGPNVDGTAGPQYFGAIVFFLFLFGALLLKGPVKWWLIFGVVFISLISMGKNHWLHGILFDLVPMFNKFRTPNSAMTVVTFLVPVLAFLGLNEMIKGKVTKKEALQSLYIAGGFMGVVCLFFALAGGSFFDFSAASDQVYAQRYPQQFNLAAIKKARMDMMSGDSWRSFLLIAAAVGAIWLFLKGKINKVVLIAALGVLIVGDLWTIDRKYLSTKDFVQPSAYKNEVSPRPVDEKILADKNPNFRVFDITGGLSGAVNSTPSTSTTSYYHKNLGGYHPAKLQRYQDLLDRHIFPEAQQLIGTMQQAKSMTEIQGAMSSLPAYNMMNTRYLIYNKDNPIANPHVNGNSWFVSTIKMVNTPNEEIDGISSIDPKETAIVHKEFADNLAGLNISKNGIIQLSSYKPNHLTYASNTNSDQLAVFSEVWYGPDKGWNAYIDGALVDHIRVNYVLRGLRVPSGKHTIEFKFEPRSYAIGSTLSLICSLLIILGLLAYIGYFLKQKMDEPEPEKIVKRVETKTKPTTSRKKKKK